MAEIRIKDLEVGQQYGLQVRAKDKDGKTSGWSMLFNALTNSDIIAPKPVTGLTWEVSESSFIAKWTAPTLDSDNKELYDLKDYKIIVTADSTSVVYYVSQQIFNFSYDMNVASFGSPKPTVGISVQARDLTGNLSTAVTASASNPIPSNVTGLDATAILGGVSLIWDQVSDADLKYYEVYSGTSSGFTPNSSNLRYTGSSNSFVYTTTDYANTQYFKVRAVDIFNQGSASYATDSSIAYPLDGPIDTTAPSKPSVLTISTATLVAQVSHPMTKNAGGNLESDVDYLEIHASTTSGFTPSSSTLRGTIDSAGPGITVSAAFYFPTQDSMTNLYWKAIAVDRAKNKSTASDQSTGLPGLIQNINILNATITDAKVQNLSAAKLIAGTAIINDLFVEAGLTVSDTGFVQSENFVADVSGWSIDAQGSAEFNDITVRGELYVDGANGDEYIRVYPITGLPTLEWQSASGVPWESYAIDYSPTVSFLKIVSPSGGGIYWVANKGIGFARVNLGDRGMFFDKNDGFLKVGSLPDLTAEGWKALSLPSGWSPDTPCQYKIFPDGMVRLRGAINAGSTPASGALIAILPVGYRPPQDHLQIIAHGATTAISRVLITTAGRIEIYNPPNGLINLHSLNFSTI